MKALITISLIALACGCQSPRSASVSSSDRASQLFAALRIADGTVDAAGRASLRDPSDGAKYEVYCVQWGRGGDEQGAVGVFDGAGRPVFASRIVGLLDESMREGALSVESVRATNDSILVMIQIARGSGFNSHVYTILSLNRGRLDEVFRSIPEVEEQTGGGRLKTSVVSLDLLKEPGPNRMILQVAIEEEGEEFNSEGARGRPDEQSVTAAIGRFNARTGVFEGAFSGEYKGWWASQKEFEDGQQTLPPVSGTRGTPAASAPAAPRIPER